jgi:hypothetical protein
MRTNLMMFCFLLFSCRGNMAAAQNETQVDSLGEKSSRSVSTETPQDDNQEPVIRFVQALAKSGEVPQFTALPFVYASTRKIQQCEGIVRSTQDQVRWIECFLKEWRILVEETKLAGVHKWETRSFEKLPAFGKKAFRSIRSARFFYGWINGDGVTFDLFVAVGNDKKVVGFGVDQEFVE